MRLHSTFPPPAQVGHQQEGKGEVLDKTYMKVVPTVVVWDGMGQATATGDGEPEVNGDDGDDDEVWENMEEADSGEEHAGGRKKSKAK